MRTSMVSSMLVAAMLLGAPAAHAQDDDPANGAAARALFQEGVSAARRGDYAEATDRFRRAHALRPAAPIAYNLASALAHQGELVEASEILEGLLRDPALPRALRAPVTRRRDEVAARVARVTVRLEGDARGVDVTLDERSLPEAAIGVSLPIDPGDHELRALRDGARVAVERVTIGEAEERDVVLTIPAREVPREAVAIAPPRERAAPASAAVEPSDGGGDDALIIGLSIAGALALGGAVTAIALVAGTPQTPAPVSGNAMPGVLTW
jgi:tetratricopeptide (TPR) repeat protein